MVSLLISWSLYHYEMPVVFFNNILCSAIYFFQGFFLLVLAWYVVFISFTFSVLLHICIIMFIVSMLKAAYSWILLWYQIWLSLPFNWSVRLFAFIVVVDVVRVKSITLVFIFLLFLSVLFLLSFCAFFLINWFFKKLFHLISFC